MACVSVIIGTNPTYRYVCLGFIKHILIWVSLERQMRSFNILEQNRFCKERNS